MAKLQNIHPGEILLEGVLYLMEISQTRLAQSVCVRPRRINKIVLGKRGITCGYRIAPVQGIWDFRVILDGVVGRIRIARSAQRNHG